MWVLESYKTLSIVGFWLLMCLLVLGSLYLTIKLWAMIEEYVEKNDLKLKEILETLKRLK